MANWINNNPNLNNVTFNDNSAEWGGGMGNYQSSPILTNVTFSGNTAVSFGGGMYNLNSNPQVRNSILWGDSAASGAEVYNSTSNPNGFLYSAASAQVRILRPKMA